MVRHLSKAIELACHAWSDGITNVTAIETNGSVVEGVALAADTVGARKAVTRVK